MGNRFVDISTRMSWGFEDIDHYCFFYVLDKTIVLLMKTMYRWVHGEDDACYIYLSHNCLFRCLLYQSKYNFFELRFHCFKLKQSPMYNIKYVIVLKIHDVFTLYVICRLNSSLWSLDWDLMRTEVSVNTFRRCSPLAYISVTVWQHKHYCDRMYSISKVSVHQ